MNEDAFCDDHDEDGEFYSREGAYNEPLILADIACIGFRWAGNLVECAAKAVETTAGAIHAVANCVGMHANYQRHQARFARTAGAAIEQITGGDS